MSASLSNLQLRIVSGAAFGAVVIAGVVYGGLPFRILCAVMAAGMFVEWRKITGSASASLYVRLTEFTFITALGAIIADMPPTVVFGILGVSSLFAFAAFLANQASGWLAGGIVYAGVPSASLAFLRGADDSGFLAAAVLFATVWATDIFAYFVGRSLGGPKLAPSISPGKTWSGAIGGLAAAVAAAMAVAAWYGSVGSPAFPIVIALVSIWSQLGDLFESWVKRRFGVKDSGTMIPGHGGMMDRVDGLAAGAVALYMVDLMTKMF